MSQKNSDSDFRCKLTFILKLSDESRSCLIDKKSYFKRNGDEYTPKLY